MTKDFTGSVTIGLDTYQVYGVLTVRGRRINGTLRFTDSEDRLIPINLIVSAGLVTFRAPVQTAFITPDDDLVVIEEIQAPSTTLDLEALTIVVTDEDCTLNGGASLFSLSIEPEAEIVEVEAVEEIAEEEITVIRKTLTPVRINEIGNQLDHFGGILSTPRLLEEKNVPYRQRIANASGTPTGSNYSGLIWSACKELGLEVSPSILLTKKTSVPSLEKVVFSIEEDRAVIYSEWVPLEQQAPGVMPTIEQETALEGMSVGGLVDWINFSELFKAKLLGIADVPAINILIASTNALIQETLSPSEKMKTKEVPVRGSLLIRDDAGLRRETAEDTRELIGDYSVDYEDGFVNPLFLPDGDVSVSYMSNLERLTLNWAPIRIVNVTSEGGQNLLFSQIEQDFYRTERLRYTNGLPNNMMFFLLREIMNGGEFPQFWGE